MSSVGILGGTFNPPHLGHLILAQEAYWQLGLERVVFMPAGNPPHREVESGVDASTRFELCRAAIGDDERFAVSRREVDSAGPSYTSETLADLASDPQSETGKDEPIFLVGGDAACGLPGWHEPERIVELAKLGVAERDLHRRKEITESLAEVAGPERLLFIDMPRIEVSSSALRERVRNGRPLDYLTPAPVVDLIESRGLYVG